MEVQISGQAERIIRSKLQSGRFTSESEVIEEALRLLDAQGETPSEKHVFTEGDFARKLVAMGLMSELPDIGSDADDTDEPISIEGEPLSETVIRERR